MQVKIPNNLKVNVGCLYRTPNTNILKFNDELLNILETVKQSKVYTCWDYNIDLLKYECYQNSKDSVNQLFSYGFYSLIRSPTRVTITITTLIDNIYTNEVGIHLENRQCYISWNTNMSNKFSYKFVRQTRDSNINNFTDRRSICNWNDVYINDDVNLAYKSFHKQCIDLYNESIS